MIPKSYRLTYQDILSLKQNSTKFSFKGFLVSFSVCDDGEQPKIGVVVSKKIAKSAVARHRIKRIIIDEVYNPQSKHNILISVQKLPEEVGLLETLEQRTKIRMKLKELSEKLLNI